MKLRAKGWIPQNNPALAKSKPWWIPATLIASWLYNRNPQRSRSPKLDSQAQPTPDGQPLATW